MPAAVARSSSNIFLTFVAAVSLALGSFWYIWVAAVYVQAKPPLSLLLMFGPSVLSMLVLFASTRSLIPLRLPAEADGQPLTVPLLLASVGAYLLLLPPFWGLARLLVTTWQNPAHPEAGLFVGLVVLWLPPWWAPLFGSLGAWLWIRRCFTSAA